MNIQKELAKLPKGELINLICDIARLVAGTKLSEEMMRVSDLDVKEIEKQLIALYYQADKKREVAREKVMAEVFKWKQ